MLKTFSIGGVHPRENKLSAHQPIIKAEVPAKAVILLGQHIGAPAKPVVAKGDVVKVGTKIAEPGGFVSAAIHSSVSGKVAKIDTIVDASGYAKPAIFIDVEGDEWEETIDRTDTLVKDCNLTAEEIVKKIADAGIVGLGGACFPTQVKLCPPPAFKAECVIINAVECEPYLTADHQLMLEHAEEIMVGVSILMKAVKVNKAFIGIENNKPDAIQLMTKVASSYAGIEIVPLKVQYPQGGEKQLIDAVINRQVAAGALPISTGAVVQNVGTAFAVYEAVQKNKPLFERIITVTGKSLAKPSNFLARIGTPMKQLIDACGGLPEDTGKIIGGGPMMGKALVNTDVPTAKGSSGILIMNDKEAKRGEIQPCIRCAKCVGACPMGLEPYLLATVSAHGDFERVEKEDIMSCIECGSCQFTCPSNRPMLDYIRLGKGKVGAMIREEEYVRRAHSIDSGIPCIALLFRTGCADRYGHFRTGLFVLRMGYRQIPVEESHHNHLRRLCHYHWCVAGIQFTFQPTYLDYPLGRFVCYRCRQDVLWWFGLQSFQPGIVGTCVLAAVFPCADDNLAGGRAVDRLC